MYPYTRTYMLRPHFVPYTRVSFNHLTSVWSVGGGSGFAYAMHNNTVALEIVPSSARQAMSGRLTGKQLISDDTS